MKRNYLMFSLAIACVYLLSSFGTTKPAAGVEYNKRMKAIMEDKCYGCHNTNSKGEKARMKLNWDELPNLPQDQQMEKIKMIQGVLAEGSMPPKPFVEKNPHKKLTEKETACLQKWAKKSAKKLNK